jgi:hypothetical protein
LDQESRGAFYALLAIRAMSKKPDGAPAHCVLTDIIDGMVRKGRFWTGKRDEDPDWIAIGFVSLIADILIWADNAGLVDQLALTTADRYAAILDRTRVTGGLAQCVRDAAVASGVWAARRRWQLTWVTRPTMR